GLNLPIALWMKCAIRTKQEKRSKRQSGVSRLDESRDSNSVVRRETETKRKLDESKVAL
ncbi:MAG: hypothetical protein ACI8W3_002196, partial [Myxococcota bacterium]